MKSMKRILALGLSAAMILSLAACGNKTAPAATADAPAGETAVAPSEETRTIRIGTWYDHYYDSTHQTIEDDPNLDNVEKAEMRLNKVRELEEKYNVKIEWVNLTWEGIQESINTSILAGSPDVDIYESDLQFGIPASLNGYATDLKTVLPETSDVLNDQVVMKYLDINTDGVYLFKPVDAAGTIEATYPLAFNKQMLDEAGLEDPRALYERGEWTWDKFKEYMIALTQDTNGDGVTDVYGFGSDYQNLLTGLMMGNGTYIAANETENLSSPEVGEVLSYMYDMYNVDKCAYPWYVDDFDTNRLWYKDGLVAFWVTAAWIMDSNEDDTLEFEVCMVPWPVGPSGNAETNTSKIVAGNFYFIPTGVENPELVYQVFYEYNNWYNDDLTIRDDEDSLTWWKDSVISEENYEVMELLGQKEQFELWNSLGVNIDIESLVLGEMTPAQVQETYKQPLQDALNVYFK